MNELDTCWLRCLRMWKWISENLPEGFDQFQPIDKPNVIRTLKAKWLKSNGFTKPLDHDCFFCEYDEQHKDRAADCSHCPARLVVRDYYCVVGENNYELNPTGFYKELLQINTERTQ